MKTYKKFECAFRRFVKNRLKAYLARILNKRRVNGLSESERSPRLIISLTSFPERVNDPLMLPVALYPLFRQTMKPNKIVLWLKEEEFPRREADVSPHVLAFKNNGLEIRWIHKNIRSYAKLVPSLKEFPSDIIVTVDDDTYYPRDLLWWLWNTHQQYPDAIVAGHCNRITTEADGQFRKYGHWEKTVISRMPSYVNFAVGFGGVLYPPGALFADVMDERLFTELAPFNDDIWFWAMAVTKRTKIVPVGFVKRPMKGLIPAKSTHFKLGTYNIVMGGNDGQISAVLNHYPEIMSVIRNE